MNPLPAITAFFKALTAALNAFPLWLAWRINSELEKLNEQILYHSALNTAGDARRADELRLKAAYHRRLHESLLPVVPAAASGHRDPDITRAIPVAD